MSIVREKKKKKKKKRRKKMENTDICILNSDKCHKFLIPFTAMFN